MYSEILQEKKAGFLGTNKVNYSKTSKCTKMLFRHLPYGTQVYFYKRDDGLLVSTNYYGEENFIMERKVQRMIHAGKVQSTYLNLNRIVDAKIGNVYFSIYRNENEDFLFKYASNEDIETFAHHNRQNTVNKAQFCSLRPYIYQLKQRYGNRLVTKMVTGTKIYLEIYGVDENAYADVKTFKDACLEKGLNVAECECANELIFRCKLNQFGTQMYMPMSFMRAGNINKMDELLMWQKDNGHIIIEANPIHCECCGKLISRYQDDAYEIHLLEHNKENMSYVRKELSSNKELTLSDLLNELLKLKETLGITQDN